VERPLARRIEDASLRAWPAIESQSLDGWELRSSGAFSKRASSVQSLGVSRLALSDKVDASEKWYRSRGLPVVFRMTPFSEPDLDDHLEARMYRVVEPTDVLSKSLPRTIEGSRATALAEAPLEDWVRTYLALSNRPPDMTTSLRGILESSTQERTLVKIPDEHRGGSVACGMAVLDHELVGLFDLATAERHRRRGFATALVAGLLNWGHARGARHAYLQVTTTNVPAQQLYRKLGFTGQYRYWYRVGPA
jgi:ribosomal protein S18 acetylase RimI-like enzyme